MHQLMPHTYNSMGSTSWAWWGVEGEKVEEGEEQQDLIIEHVAGTFVRNGVS